MTSVVANEDKEVKEVIEAAGIARNAPVEAAKAFQPSLYVKQSQLGKLLGMDYLPKPSFHMQVYISDYAGKILSTSDAMKEKITRT